MPNTPVCDQPDSETLKLEGAPVISFVLADRGGLVRQADDAVRK
jgi:hypothetical protein